MVITKKVTSLEISGYEITSSEMRKTLRQLVNDNESQDRINKFLSLSNKKVLEIGAGYGSMSEFFCRKVGKAGKVISTELKLPCINELKKISKLHRNLEFINGDIFAMNNNELKNKIDLIYSRFVFEHMSKFELKRNLLLLESFLDTRGYIIIEDGVYNTFDLYGDDGRFRRVISKYVKAIKDDVTNFDVIPEIIKIANNNSKLIALDSSSGRYRIFKGNSVEAAFFASEIWAKKEKILKEISLHELLEAITQLRNSNNIFRAAATEMVILKGGYNGL